MSMKKSNDTLGNRTRDLPVCSAVPQPTELPREKVREHPKFGSKTSRSSCSYTVSWCYHVRTHHVKSILSRMTLISKFHANTLILLEWRTQHDPHLISPLPLYTWKYMSRYAVAYRGGGLGCSNPTRNSEGPPKLCQTQPDL